MVFNFKPALEKDTVFYINLKPTYGILNLNYTPKDAKIYINDSHYMNPNELDGVLKIILNKGSYFLTVKKNGYTIFKEKISIQSLKSQVKSIKLKPIFADVTIQSFPNEANIYIDGNLYLKPTHAKLTKVLSGKRVLSIYKDNYQLYIDTILIKPKVKNLFVIQLKPLIKDTAKFIKEFNPKLLSNIELVNNTDFRKYIDNLNSLERNKIKEESFGYPRSLKGNLYIYTFPQNASILINNIEIKNKTNAFIQLPVGKYNLTLFLPGFGDYHKLISIKTHKSTKINWILGRQIKSNKLTFKKEEFHLLSSDEKNLANNTFKQQFDTIKYFNTKKNVAGAEWGLIEMFIPPIGAAKTEKNSSWIWRGLLFWGGVAASIVLENQAKTTYKQYLNSPIYIDRAALLNKANVYHKLSLISAGFTASFYLYDVIRTFSAGARNTMFKKNK